MTTHDAADALTRACAALAEARQLVQDAERLAGLRPGSLDEHWVSVTEYAERHRVTRRTVEKWLGAGLLVSYRVGRVRRILWAMPGAIPCGVTGWNPANERGDVPPCVP